MPNTGTQSFLFHKKGARVLSRDDLAILQVKSIGNRAVSLQVLTKDSKTIAILYLLGSVPNLLSLPTVKLKGRASASHFNKPPTWSYVSYDRRIQTQHNRA